MTGDGSAGNIASLSNTGNQITDLAGGGNYNLFFTPNTWQTLEMDYVLGSSQMTVTLDNLSDTKGIGSN